MSAQTRHAAGTERTLGPFTAFQSSSWTSFIMYFLEEVLLAHQIPSNVSPFLLPQVFTDA